MKRTISLIIAIAVMVSMFIVPVSAADVTSADAIVAGESVLQNDVAKIGFPITSGDYVIDLNGYKWTGSLSISGGNVTIKNGTVDASQVGDAITVSGSAVVVLDGVTVIGAYGGGDAIFVDPGTPDLTIKNCVLTAGKAGIDNTNATATVKVENTNFADFTYGPKDPTNRNCAVELRNGAKITFNGANEFEVTQVIRRTNTHSAAFSECLLGGENVTISFADTDTDLGDGSGNQYHANTITYVYEAPEATPTATAEATPTATATAEPTVEPTSEPTVEPTTEPTVEPTTEPTAEPTDEVAVPVEDVEFDLEAMGGTASFADHGYGDTIGLMFGYGNYKSLGNLDLSKYSKIIITYATHHPFLNRYDDMPCNAMFAICSNGTTVGYSNVDKREEAGILAQQDCTDSTDIWVNGERTCEIDLSNVDYNGEVFLSHYNSTGMEALVTSIVLVAAEGATTTVPGGSTGNSGSNSNPNTNTNPNTGNFMPFVIVIAAAAFVVTVVSKKRAF